MNYRAELIVEVAQWLIACGHEKIAIEFLKWATAAKVVMRQK